MERHLVGMLEIVDVAGVVVVVAVVAEGLVVTVVMGAGWVDND